jgi:two-component system, NarL family, response regulator LiaR
LATDLMPVPKTVLIADDNSQIRRLLCRMFEAEADYDLCAEEKDGDEAISLALKHKPDLIVLDLVMPRLNEIEAANKLKELLPYTEPSL